MITSEQYLAHKKVKEAHRLLIEAWQELRIEEEEERDKTICECGHEGTYHGPPHSCMFVRGACEKCQCLNFKPV